MSARLVCVTFNCHSDGGSFRAHTRHLPSRGGTRWSDHSVVMNTGGSMPVLPLLELNVQTTLLMKAKWSGREKFYEKKFTHLLFYLFIYYFYLFFSRWCSHNISGISSYRTWLATFSFHWWAHECQGGHWPFLSLPLHSLMQLTWSEVWVALATEGSSSHQPMRCILTWEPLRWLLWVNASVHIRSLHLRPPTNHAAAREISSRWISPGDKYDARQHVAVPASLDCCRFWNSTVENAPCDTLTWSCRSCYSF